ncbi:MAG: penicillin acylase family protein [Pseudomonadota bacterium]
MTGVSNILKYVAIGLAGSIGLIALAFFLWLRSTLPDYEKTLTNADLEGPVTIVRNEFGIPHIEAGSFNDAAFAIGYVQAQDRLWQMEAMRRAVLGRAAEILGEMLLPLDIRYRLRFNTSFVRERSFERLDPEMRQTFEAFAAGVNFAIENGEGKRSPEWRLLGFEPEPWTGADINNMMTASLDLSTGGATEIRRANHQLVLDEEDLTLAYAPLQGCFPTTYEDVEISDWAGERIVDQCAQQTTAASAFGDPALEGYGTNLFVVGPERSTTGSPILAVDPHLPAQSPGLIYPVSISLPDKIIAGGAWIGSPAVAFGHNSRIAWGMTHLYADTTDFIVEKINPENPDEYMTLDGPKPFGRREEVFKVRGGDPVTIDVRTTENGIIVSDIPTSLEEVSDREGDFLASEFAAVREVFGPGHVVAMKQTVMENGSLSIQSTIKASRARNWAEFRDALREYEATNNLVYADVDGNIGLQMSAKIPLRRQINGWNGQRFARGWLGEGKWDTFVPFDELAFVLNPPKGWIADSNSRAVSDAFDHRVADIYSPPWRVSRSTQLLGNKARHDLDSIKSIQLDIYSTKAEWLLETLGQFEMTSARGRGAFDLLRAWDRKMDKDRPEPLLYAAFELALQQRLINDRAPVLAGTSGQVIRLQHILERDLEWCDHLETDRIETCEMAVNEALEAAIDRLSAEHGEDISKWRWGDAHIAEFDALYSWSAIPILKDLTQIKAEIGGSEATLNVAAMSRPESAKKGLLGTLRFNSQHVATFRSIIDLSNLANSQYASAPGMSANAYSPHWNDMAAPWAKGEYFHLHGRSSEHHKSTTISPIK